MAELNTGDGGGGKGGSQGTAGISGTANTGGGGGGGYENNNGNAGSGGSGIVIIKYADTYPDLTSIGGGLTYTKTTSGGKTIYKFTAGTGNISW